MMTALEGGLHTNPASSVVATKTFENEHLAAAGCTSFAYSEQYLVNLNKCRQVHNLGTIQLYRT